MTNEIDHVQPLSNKILTCIRDYFEEGHDESRTIPIAISALTTNLVAFICGEEAWDESIRKEIVDKIHVNMLEGIK